MATDEKPPSSREPQGAHPPVSPPHAGPAPALEPVGRLPRRISRRAKLLWAAAVVILSVGSFLLWRYFNSYEETDDAQVDVHLYPVSSRIPGYVIQVKVEDNQYVEKGTVLVEVDPEDYRVAVDKARAEFGAAKATAQSLNLNTAITSVGTSSQLKSTASDVENARLGIDVAEKRAAAARAQLEEAEAVDVQAQADLKRYKALVDKHEVSSQIYDQAFAAAKSSAAAVVAAQANLAAALQAVEQAKSHLVRAQANYEEAQTGPKQVAATRGRALSAIADVENKRAALEQAELNLRYTKIVAPVSGMVSKKVVVGMYVQPGQQLLTVVPLDDVWITANFKETQLRRMRPGQAVEIEVDSNGRTYKGTVDSLAGATGPLFSLLPPENATGNYVKIVQRVPVKIVLESGANHDHQLRPGMNVIPKVHLQ